jgi:hypothetical protein
MKLLERWGVREWEVWIFENRILGAFLGVDVGMIKVTIEVGFACVGGGGCVLCGSGIRWDFHLVQFFFACLPPLGNQTLFSKPCCCHYTRDDKAFVYRAKAQL